jgi:hypothetical protein
LLLEGIVSGDEILSGAEFCELDGEHHVFEELSDDQIVTMVQTDNADIECSDEDEQDDYVPSKTTIADALLHVQRLQEFAFSRPDLFTSESVRALHAVQHDLQKHRLEQQKMGSIKSFFAHV